LCRELRNIMIQSCPVQRPGDRGIDQSIRMEASGDLAEFGALWKTVTLDEAKVKL
jgi:hypothetical protein